MTEQKEATRERPLFSVLIPTWNNLAFLKLCIRSIEQNSTYRHEILIHVNDGSDGTLEWVRQSGYAYRHTPKNVGVSWALNGLRPLVTTDYVLFLNDDMYVCPEWDKHLWDEIQRIGHNRFFLSSTLLQPRPFFSKAVIAPANYGETVETFDEARLLKEYNTLPHPDWKGATWPPNIVHRDLWDLVGGYSVEFTPGLGSDPDFTAKLYLAGVRIFKGVSASRVYHFEARSTGRARKNDGMLMFLRKWRLTPRAFLKTFMQRGEPYDAPAHNEQAFKAEQWRCRLKYSLTMFKNDQTYRLWDESNPFKVFTDEAKD